MPHSTHSLTPPASVASAIAATVQVAQDIFASQFPDQDFHATVWDLTALNRRPATLRGRYLHFTLRDRTGPFPDSFAHVIKSWIVLEGKGMGDRYCRVQAAGYLCEVVMARRQSDTTAFQWQDLTVEDMRQTETVLLGGLAHLTAYHYATYLQDLLGFLHARQIDAPRYWASQIPHPQRYHQHISRERAGHGKPLPTPRTLQGLADCYREAATDPADRLQLAALALLVVSGLRLGELLTLPYACEVEETYRGQLRYGLRYYREKVRAGPMALAVRWLTPAGTQLARPALAEIRAITLPFRQQAQALEQSPNHIVLPNVLWSGSMTPQQVAAVTGIAVTSLHQISPTRLPRHGRRGHCHYEAADVEAFLLKARKPLWTLDRGDGTYLALSETLLITAKNFFGHKNGITTALVEPISALHLQRFLLGIGGKKSVFERFNLREADGTLCKLTTHQLRHWLNDLADKGGLPVDLQTRWMGRDTPQQTYAYHHATVEERLAWVKAGIRDGMIGGLLADGYFQLPEDERDIFLEGQIQAVHFTPLGICLHDFSIDPCPYHLNCVRGCRDYVRIKGNQAERQQLIQVASRTKKALTMAETFAQQSGTAVADAWLDHHQATLAGVERALALDDVPDGSEAEQIAPFLEMASKFQAIP